MREPIIRGPNEESPPVELPDAPDLPVMLCYGPKRLRRLSDRVFVLLYLIRKLNRRIKIWGDSFHRNHDYYIWIVDNLFYIRKLLGLQNLHPPLSQYADQQRVFSWPSREIKRLVFEEPPELLLEDVFELLIELEKCGFSLVRNERITRGDWSVPSVLPETVRRLGDVAKRADALCHQLPGGPYTRKPGSIDPNPPGVTPCQMDILRTLKNAGARLSKSALLLAMHSSGLIHGESTIRMALPRLRREGLIDNDQKSRPCGYGLTPSGKIVVENQDMRRA